MSGSSQATDAATNPTATTRQDHNTFQSEYFTRELIPLQKSITAAVEKQLGRVADAVPGLGPYSRVLDVGAGDGALIPHLQAKGVQDIVAVDVCPAMIEALHKRLGYTPSTVGNEPAVRSWIGDVVDLPAYYGPFDAAFFNSVFGNLHDQREALLRTVFLVRPGGWIVISHPLGRLWLEQYAKENPQVVPHGLPTRDELEALISDLPLELVSYKDDFSMYLARLKIPEGYSHRAAPLRLAGEVVAGFGRGSKQLGVPTANLAPGPLEDELRNIPTGVYFGWARLDAGPGAPLEDSAVHKMAMNVGRRPTFEDKDPELSVEIHIMHSFAAEDFHGRQLRVVGLGFIRPEIKFSGLKELLDRIHTDIGIAKAQLETPPWKLFKEDSFLQEF